MCTGHSALQRLLTYYLPLSSFNVVITKRVGIVMSHENVIVNLFFNGIRFTVRISTRNYLLLKSCLF